VRLPFMTLHRRDQVFGYSVFCLDYLCSIVLCIQIQCDYVLEHYVGESKFCWITFKFFALWIWFVYFGLLTLFGDCVFAIGL
jgi:hypothetical protein